MTRDRPPHSDTGTTRDRPPHSDPAMTRDRPPHSDPAMTRDRSSGSDPAMTRDRSSSSSSGRSFADLVAGDPAVARIEKRRVQAHVKASGKRRPAEPGAKAPAPSDEPPGDAARLFRGDIPPGDFRDLRSGRIRPGGRIDLHRLDRSQAQHALRKAFGTASAQGTHCLLVIHGRGRRSPLGEATLASALPGWLRSTPLDAWVRGFAPALPRDGGDGATYVWLRTPRRARESRTKRHPR